MEIPECPTCERLHYPGDYCPRRVARALTGQPASLLALNDSDIAKIKALTDENFRIEDLVEEHLAEG